MAKQLLKERFQQLAGIKPLYQLNELDLGQRAMGLIDKTKSWFKNLAPSGDGKDIESWMTAKGISTKGTTFYDVVQDGTRFNARGTFNAEELAPSSLEKTVKVNQYQIDNATLDSAFRASQVTWNFHDNIPKMEAKIHILNLETGKYEYLKDEADSIESQDIINATEGDMAEFEKVTADPISISLQDLKTRVSSTNENDEAPQAGGEEQGGGEQGGGDEVVSTLIDYLDNKSSLFLQIKTPEAAKELMAALLEKLPSNIQAVKSKIFRELI